MSIKCQSWVYEHSESTGNDRLILLAIADEANDDGTNAYPSVDLIAHKARVNKRTTLRCIERLEEAGELIVHRPEVRGRGRFNTYVVLMGRNGDTLSPIPDSENEQEAQDVPKKGDRKVRNGAQPYLIGTRPTDPLTQTTARKSPSTFPAQFLVTTALKEWARKEAPNVDLSLHTKAFALYWREGDGAGKKKTNWDATWKNWMLRESARSRPTNGAARPTNGYVQTAGADAVMAPDEYELWMDELEADRAKQA